MENISIILSDLDGTLFHDDKSISDYSKAMIAETQKKGVLFGVCTSRAGINAIKYLDGLSPDILITNGGGIVTCREKIYSCEFSVEEIRTLIDATFKVFGPDAVLSVDNEFGLYSNSKEELPDKFWEYNDFSDFNEPCMKLCIESLDKEKIEKVVSSIGLDKIDYLPFSDIPWYKLSKKGATKEKAIEALCSHLKISPAQIAAFGDDYNDIGMLKLCGKGIAMKNAIPEVQKIADEVCKSNEADGVADWIKENIL
ncbi:haloacid dehalogenase-like hydrolase [Treponema bryantii]|uniref:Haloacid dehalogenase-like hydrolase n=1 Tax=Treponema bryantii TaxID=163 RepID=A0A1H9CAK9_9SPIR|nr:HAD family hydrolase [Treponema bryantii]SEP98031.1 haloacid dehalogenase-like hydrolase [Treponema bryantii]